MKTRKKIKNNSIKLNIIKNIKLLIYNNFNKKRKNMKIKKFFLCKIKIFKKIFLYKNKIFKRKI